MKPFRFLLVVIFAVSLALALSSAAPSTATPVPAGLTAADWAAIQSFLPGDYIKASNTEMSDDFGIAIAIDGNTVVVGAPREDSNATGVNGNQADNSVSGAGAAYVFIRTEEGWSQQAYLKASNPMGGARFGYSVAIDGDTIIVGTYEAEMAYIYTRTGETWSQQAFLQASNTQISDYFGHAVAIDGDTVVVGAWSESSGATGVDGNQADNSASKAGAAYVFTRIDGMWSQQAYLKASNTEADDYFGHAVRVDGDTVIVGAWFEDSSATGIDGNQADNSADAAGAAYVFTRTGGVWSQQAYLKASNTGADDFFGHAVAISGDTVAIGAFGESSNATEVNGDQTNNSASNAGAIYVFTRTGGVWSQQAYLKVSNSAIGDWFGYRVALDGDTVVGGALYEDSNATGVNGDQTNNSAFKAGAAYVFTRTGGVWSQQAYLKASNTDDEDEFSTAVAVSGDTIVVGAPLEDSNAVGINGDQSNNSASSAGAVYLFVAEPQLSVQVVGEGLVTSAPAGIDCGVVCTALLAPNTVITLTATADLGSTFTGWSGDVLTTTNPIMVTMDSAKAITATFALNQYTITLSAEPAAGGTVAGGGSVTHGQMVTATATAETGYTFLHWTEGGDVVSIAANYSFTATTNRALVAHFAADAPKIYLPLVVR